MSPQTHRVVGVILGGSGNVERWGLPGVGTWGYITQTSSYWCFLVHSNVNSSCIYLTPTPMTLSSNYGLHPPNCEVNSSDLYISSITNFGRRGEIDNTGSSCYCDQWRSSGKVHVHRDTNKPWEVFPVLRQQMLDTVRGSFPQPVSPHIPVRVFLASPWWFLCSTLLASICLSVQLWVAHFYILLGSCSSLLRP